MPFYIGGNGDAPVSAFNNWWGTDDLVAVAELIWDIYDDQTLFKVLYDPILEAPEPTTGHSSRGSKNDRPSPPEETPRLSVGSGKEFRVKFPR